MSKLEADFQLTRIILVKSHVDANLTARGVAGRSLFMVLEHHVETGCVS